MEGSQDSGMQQICTMNPDSGILVFGIRNTAQGILNPPNDWNQESKFHSQRIRNSVPGVWNPKSRIQDCLGSHMLPSYLRHSCWCCLRHRSDMRTEVAGNRGHVSLYRRHACEVDSSSTSQACRQ